MMAAAATIGSMPSCGRAPCAPLPVTSMVNARPMPPAGRLRHNLADGKATVHVAAEDGSHLIERATGQNCRRTIPDFLGRLQHDQYVAARGLACQQHRGANGPRRMNVMAARMHNAGVFG